MAFPGTTIASTADIHKNNLGSFFDIRRHGIVRESPSIRLQKAAKGFFQQGIVSHLCIAHSLLLPRWQHCRRKTTIEEGAEYTEPGS